MRRKGADGLSSRECMHLASEGQVLVASPFTRGPLAGMQTLDSPNAKQAMHGTTPCNLNFRVVSCHLLSRLQIQMKSGLGEVDELETNLCGDFGQYAVLSPTSRRS